MTDRLVFAFAKPGSLIFSLFCFLSIVLFFFSWQPYLKSKIRASAQETGSSHHGSFLCKELRKLACIFSACVQDGWGKFSNACTLVSPLPVGFQSFSLQRCLGLECLSTCQFSETRICLASLSCHHRRILHLQSFSY